MPSLVLAWIEAFTNALLPALLALALVCLRRHRVNIVVIEAVGRAAGEAYRQMVQSGASITHSTALAAAVAAGCDYLAARIPDALKAAGITPEGAAQMVSAELGKLLAIDPTVGVGIVQSPSFGTRAPDGAEVAVNRLAREAAAAPSAEGGAATAANV
jgi:hypothetical protein